MEAQMNWVLDYVRENVISVSRIYLQKENIDIYNKETWSRANPFMYENMMKLESFNREYNEYLKYGPQQIEN